MAELFVTGGDGWLGRNFLEALRADTDEPSSLVARYKKINVLSLSDQVVEGNFEVQRSFGDIRDKDVSSEFLSGCEGGTLINIAGVIHPKFFSREFWQVNNLAISSLAKLAFQKGMKKAVFLSSNSVCGFNNDELPMFDQCSHPLDTLKSASRLHENSIITFSTFFFPGRFSTPKMIPKSSKKSLQNYSKIS